MLRFAASLLFIVPFPLIAEAQETNSPELQPVFSDDFSEDTRSAYKLSGDVSWEQGKLTLVEGASIERTIDGGAWAKLELGLRKLTDEQPRSEYRVWFVLNGATPCYIRFRHELKDGKPVHSLALIDTGQTNDKPIELIVRQRALQTDRDLGRMSVEYRHGLVVISGPSELLIAAIYNGAATVQSVRFQVLRNSLPLQMVAATTLAPNSKDFSAKEQQQLAQARKDLSKMLQLYRRGRFDEAAKVGERVLEVRRLVLGKEHRDYATSLNDLAGVYYSLDDYARAEPLWVEAKTIREKVLGKEHPSYAATLFNLAVLYDSMEDYAQAEPLYVKAKAINEKVLGNGHPSYAKSLNGLGCLYHSVGDYARAERLLVEAKTIYRRILGKKHASYATSLNNLAALYESTGDYARAVPLYLEAKTIREKVLGKDHREYGASLINLAGLYASMGDYARAKPLFVEAKTIVGKVLGKQHPDYAKSLNNLAALYARMEDYVRAEPLYIEAKAIEERVLGKEHSDYAMSLNNLALLYESRRDYARAEPLYVEAKTIFGTVLGKEHPLYATSLHNLAGLCESMGDYARAEPLYLEAKTIDERVLGKEHPKYATSLHNLAALYESMGDYARAEPLNSQAVAIVQRNLELSSLVQSERQQKRHQSKQRRFLDSRLAIAFRSGAPASQVLQTLWKWKGAVTFRQQTYRRVAANPKLAPVFDSLQSVSGQLSALSGRAPVPPPNAAPEITHENFQRKRKRWEEQFTTLNRQRENLEQQIATDSAEFRELREALTVAAVQDLLPDATAFVDFLDYRHSTPDPYQKGKTNYERRYIAFVVRPDRQPAMIGLGVVESLGEAVIAFRRRFAADPSKLKEAPQAARRLRRKLWLPLEEHLDGIETVVISPDTALGTVPFAAIPGAEEGSYLLERYRFASLPLVGMLRTLFEADEERPQPEKGLLVLGDVDYSANPLLAQADTQMESRPAWMRRSAPRSGVSDWRSLPGFQQELAIVRDQFESKFGSAATTLRKDKATEAAFIKQAPRHYNLHLITHGFFADPEFEAMSSSGEDDPRSGGLMQQRLGDNRLINQYMPGLLSGIVLAGANNPPPTDSPDADGILTASEIESLDLTGVDLVVLSACETGLGKTAGGEGLTGLQRAFHIAGARSCIATLWEVDDKATQEMMSRFYRNYWTHGQSKIDALRNAQLEILRDPSLT